MEDSCRIKRWQVELLGVMAHVGWVFVIALVAQYSPSLVNTGVYLILLVIGAPAFIGAYWYAGNAYMKNAAREVQTRFCVFEKSLKQPVELYQFLKPHHVERYWTKDGYLDFKQVMSYEPKWNGGKYILITVPDKFSLYVDEENSKIYGYKGEKPIEEMNLMTEQEWKKQQEGFAKRISEYKDKQRNKHLI